MIKTPRIQQLQEARVASESKKAEKAKELEALRGLIAFLDNRLSSVSIESIKDSVEVSNLDEVSDAFSYEIRKLSTQLQFLSEQIKALDKNDPVEISNIKDIPVQKYVEVTNLSQIKFPEQVTILNLSEVKDAIAALAEEIKQIKIDAPKIEIPKVVIPAPVVNIAPADVKITTEKTDVSGVIKAVEQGLTNIRENSVEKPLAVRLTDGKKFLSSMAASIERGFQVVSGSVQNAIHIKNDAGSQINPSTEETLVNCKAALATMAGTRDSFSRFRMSAPQSVFDAQFTYDLQPLLFEQISSGSGASIAKDTTNNMALMTFSSTPATGKAFLQSFEHFRYQPGKTQLVFCTFNMLAGVSNCLKFAGYSDGTNGIEFQLNGSTKQFTIYSSTTTGNETVPQSEWNIDKLDGTGASGYTLDISKTQIFVIDLQALYVGRVRVGFDIDGEVYYAHEFKHANVISYPYIATANLPVRCGMTCTGTVSTTMNFICCSVISEGGQEETVGYGFNASGSVTAGSGARTHLLSVRPLTTFNSVANRTKFVLDSISMIVTGSNPVKWELVLGQAISGTTAFNAVNATYSAFEFNTAGTISGSPVIVIDSGYIAASATSKNSTETRVPLRYPITLDAAGAVRSLGTLSLIVSGIGGTSACQGDINWREIR